MRLNARQLRTHTPTDGQKKLIRKNPIYIVLDNVLDTYNIGAIFRLADAVAAEKVCLCGDTETPPNPRIKKASIDTWKWVDWEYFKSAEEALLKLRTKDKELRIIVVEQDPKGIPLGRLEVSFPVAVVVGNESYGVSEEVLRMADTIVELPMFGINRSLNVMVSCGIVLYKIVESI